MRPQSPVGKKRTMRQTPPNIRSFSSFSTMLPLLPHSSWYPFCFSSLWIVLCSVSLTYSTVGCPKTLLTCGVIRSYNLLLLLLWWWWWSSSSSSLLSLFLHSFGPHFCGPPKIDNCCCCCSRGTRMGKRHGTEGRRSMNITPKKCLTLTSETKPIENHDFSFFFLLLLLLLLLLLQRHLPDGKTPWHKDGEA